MAANYNGRFDKMKLYFIRHGKTLGNSQGRYVGRTDEPLLAESITELKKIDPPLVEHVFSSPKKRCLQTAHCLYPTAAIEVIESLAEMDFGAFEYKNYQELNGDLDYQAYLDSGGTIGFPQSEPLAQFKQRCIQAFCATITKAKQKQYTAIAYVVHGGTIMAILEKYARPEGSYFEWQIKNGAMVIGELDQEGFIHMIE
jgi:alpha-ribazole phosphatase